MSGRGCDVHPVLACYVCVRVIKVDCTIEEKKQKVIRQLPPEGGE
jgi:hypothetical protein